MAHLYVCVVWLIHNFISDQLKEKFTSIKHTNSHHSLRIEFATVPHSFFFILMTSILLLQPLNWLLKLFIFSILCFVLKMSKNVLNCLSITFWKSFRTWLAFLWSQTVSFFSSNETTAHKLDNQFISLKMC